MKLTMKLFVILPMLAAVAWLVPQDAVVGHASTVERQPQGDKKVKHVGTVPQGKPCVLNLTAPKSKAECHLKPYDPPAKLVVKGWYFVGNNGTSIYSEGTADTIKNGQPVDDRTAKVLDKVAFEYLVNRGSATVFQFFGYDPMPFEGSPPATLDAPPGGSNKYELKGAYTLDELKAYKVTVLKWARAWKRYRGSKYMKKQ